MTIKFSNENIEMSVNEADALLAFAGKDPTRKMLGVGVDDSFVCATDGHAAMRLLCLTPGGTQPAERNGSIWSHAYVTTRIKMAKAIQTPVTLLFSDRVDAVFPPLSKLIPKDGCDARETIGFNPSILARLVKVAKACDTDTVILAGCSGSLDPALWKVNGREQSAEVVIMPMRH